MILGDDAVDVAKPSRVLSIDSAMIQRRSG